MAAPGVPEFTNAKNTKPTFEKVLGLPEIHQHLAQAPEVAALLRTSRKAIYAMVERGQLPGVTRVRRRLLVRTEELVDWLHESRAPSSEGDRR